MSEDIRDDVVRLILTLRAENERLRAEDDMMRAMRAFTLADQPNEHGYSLARAVNEAWRALERDGFADTPRDAHRWDIGVAVDAALTRLTAERDEARAIERRTWVDHQKAADEVFAVIDRRGYRDAAVVGMTMAEAVEAVIDYLEHARDVETSVAESAEAQANVEPVDVADWLIRAFGDSIAIEWMGVALCGHVEVAIGVSGVPFLSFTRCDPPGATDEDRRAAADLGITLGRAIGMRRRWALGREWVREFGSYDPPTEPTSEPRPLTVAEQRRGIGPDLRDAPDLFDMLPDEED
ncbi:MAG: hypothetical protein Q8Q14_00645 [Gemmatimonadales bacterium]|nr:hypothetical protein [Gemmatimonadales bacterium]